MPLTTEVTPLKKNQVRLNVAVPEDVVRRCMARAIRGWRATCASRASAREGPGNVIVQRLGRE